MCVLWCVCHNVHVGGGVFGVPLVTLVTCEGTDVPKIIRRVVEHVEQYGTVVLSNKTLFISALHFIE